MKNFKFFLVFVSVLALGFTFSSCSDDEENADIRDNVVGTYNFTVKSYTIENEELVLQGEDTGSLTVKKNEGNATTIDFYDGADLMFQGNKIVEAANGLAFDIPSQSYSADGVTVTMVGFDYWDLGGTTYQGAYLTATKKMQFAFVFSIEIEGVEAQVVTTFEGTKQ